MTGFELPPNEASAEAYYESLTYNELLAATLAKDALLKTLLQRQGEAERDSLHDDLTGLPNKRALRKSYESKQAQAGRRAGDTSNKPDLMIFIDLDDFKIINDTKGHIAGDASLIRVAQLLTVSLRAGDEVGRWGGDEFMAILVGANLNDGQHFTDRMRANATIFASADESIAIPKFSVGLSPISYALSFDEMSKKADRAMYQAKQAGKDQLIVLPPTTIDLL